MYQIKVNNKSNIKSKVVIYCFIIMLLSVVSPSAYKTVYEDFSYAVTDDYYRSVGVSIGGCKIVEGRSELWEDKK